MPEASPPIPNPIPSETVKSTKGSAAVKSHSNSVVIPSNDNVESNDNFVVLDPKIESEMNTDHNEDRSEGKFPNWTARVNVKIHLFISFTRLQLIQSNQFLQFV